MKQNLTIIEESVLICVNLWLKISQSKITNYAKRTQFFKKSNVYNLNKNNELQQKMDNGHLVKTNPKQTQTNPILFAVLSTVAQRAKVEASAKEDLPASGGLAGLPPAGPSSDCCKDKFAAYFALP